MSFTGIWKWDARAGQMVRISERIPHVSQNDWVSHVPEGGYYSRNLQTYVRDRTHKRQVMAAQGVREVETGEKFRRKTPEQKRMERRAALERILP